MNEDSKEGMCVMAVHVITKENFETELLSCSDRAVVDFRADWCGECRLLLPELERAAAQHTSVPFYTVDCSEDRALAEQYGIMSIPALLLFENGKELRRKIGFATAEEIGEFVTE